MKNLAQPKNLGVGIMQINAWTRNGNATIFIYTENNVSAKAIGHRGDISKKFTLVLIADPYSVTFKIKRSVFSYFAGHEVFNCIKVELID